MSGFKTSKRQKKSAKKDQSMNQGLLDVAASNDAVLDEMKGLDSSMKGGKMGKADMALETLGAGTGILANKIGKKMGGQDKSNAPKSKGQKKRHKAAMIAKTGVDAIGLIPGVNAIAHLTGGVAANTVARKTGGANYRQAIGGAVVDEGLAALKGLIPIYGQLDAVQGLIADFKALKDGIADMDPGEAITEYKKRLSRLDELEDKLALECNDLSKLAEGQKLLEKQRERLNKAIQHAEKVKNQKGDDQASLLNDQKNDMDWGDIFADFDNQEEQQKKGFDLISDEELANVDMMEDTQATSKPEDDWVQF